MIRRLRRRHFAWSLALAALGPAAVLGSMAARPDPDRLTVAALPAGPADPNGPDAVRRSFPLRIVVTRDQSTGELIVSSEPRKPLRLADPLLYFAPTPPHPGDTILPPGARLVGAAGGDRVTVSRVTFPSRGPLWAVLWSNAHPRVDAVAPAVVATGR